MYKHLSLLFSWDFLPSAFSIFLVQLLFLSSYISPPTFHPRQPIINFSRYPPHHPRLRSLSYDLVLTSSSTYSLGFLSHLSCRILVSRGTRSTTETTACDATRTRHLPSRWYTWSTRVLLGWRNTLDPRKSESTGEQQKTTVVGPLPHPEPPKSFCPLGTLLRRGYFRPLRCSLSLPPRCPRYSADFLAISGKPHPHPSFPKISSVRSI